MLLIGVKEDDGWLYSLWNLTSGAGWLTICKGGRVLLDDFDKPEVFVDGERIPPFKDPKEIMDIPESREMRVRGFSKTLGLPVMVDFYNQTKSVEVTLPASEKVVATTDYETFNKEIAPFVDSMEIMMF